MLGGSSTHTGSEAGKQPRAGWVSKRKRSRAIRLLLAGCAVGAAVALPVWASDVALQATDDTWINGLTSTTTHGNDLSLGICPVADCWIYLKFDLHGLVDPIAAAELRMTRTSGARPAGDAGGLLAPGWDPHAAHRKAIDRGRAPELVSGPTGQECRRRTRRAGRYRSPMETSRWRRSSVWRTTR